MQSMVLLQHSSTWGLSTKIQRTLWIIRQNDMKTEIFQVATNMKYPLPAGIVGTPWDTVQGALHVYEKLFGLHTLEDGCKTIGDVDDFVEKWVGREWRI